MAGRVAKSREKLNGNNCYSPNLPSLSKVIQMKRKIYFRIPCIFSYFICKSEFLNLHPLQSYMWLLHYYIKSISPSNRCDAWCEIRASPRLLYYLWVSTNLQVRKKWKALIPFSFLLPSLGDGEPGRGGEDHDQDRNCQLHHMTKSRRGGKKRKGSTASRRPVMDCDEKAECEKREAVNKGFQRRNKGRERLDDDKEIDQDS